MLVCSFSSTEKLEILAFLLVFPYERVRPSDISTIESGMMEMEGGSVLKWCGKRGREMKLVLLNQIREIVHHT